jgi:hypothetical protein
MGVDGREDNESRCLTIEKTFPGQEALVIIVVTPTEAANSAAINFVTIPPVPTLLPGEETMISRDVEGSTVGFEDGDVFDDFDGFGFGIGTRVIGV